VNTGIRGHLSAIRKAFGPNIYNDFLLEHGGEYAFGPASFEGERGEKHGCFMNSLHLAFDPAMTYVEGKVSCHGVPLDHAWCIDGNGFVIDPTLEDKGQTLEYFGIPFQLEYVKRVVVAHQTYGSVLDYYFAGKTAPKLYELGLEAGQQWLLDMTPTAVRKLGQTKRRA
jgi:hypothetical protein